MRPRRVQPWRIAARRGGWYLVGLDLDRGAPRSYRLSRVEGRVRASGPRDAFEVPAHVDVDAALGTRDAGGLARLAVVPERAGRCGRAARSWARCPTRGRATARAATCSSGVRRAVRDGGRGRGYGDAVLVLGPPDLREAVVRRLRDAAGLATGPADGGGQAEVERG